MNRMNRKSHFSSLLLSSLELSVTNVYELQIRARLGTDARFCKIVILKLRTETSTSERTGDEKSEGVQALLSDSQGQNPALTVYHMCHIRSTAVSKATCKVGL